MIDHPTPEELEAFVWDRGPAGGAPEIAAHLMQCEACRETVLPHVRAICGWGEPPPRALSLQEDAAYDAVLDRVFATTVQQYRQLQEERKQEALAFLATGDPNKLYQTPAHVGGLPYIEALLEQSWALRHEDPERMMHLAEWACFYAQKAYLPDLSPEQRKDLQCRVSIELGNAYRVADRLDEAQNLMDEAAALFLEGSRDPFLNVRLLDIQASLFGARRLFNMAGSALDAVINFHRKRGDQHKEGRALISRGTYLGYEGKAENAVQLIQQGLEIIDRDQDPRLVFLATHNQARFFVDCGRLRDAQRVIFELRNLKVGPGGRINELKVRWLEGQIFVGLGKLDRAERALRTVKDGFNELDLVYKAALAGLELGAVLLRRGNSDDAEEEIILAANVFLALKIRREATMAVMLLKQSAERRQVDAALLEYVISLLRRSEDSLEGE